LYNVPVNNVCRKFDQVIEGKKTKELKCGHTLPGECVPVDHYISTVTYQLPHTYGRERQEYQAGTLCAGQHSLEYFAQDKGFKIKNCITQTMESFHQPGLLQIVRTDQQMN
jgi:hypothetical protein